MVRKRAWTPAFLMLAAASLLLSQATEGYAVLWWVVSIAFLAVALVMAVRANSGRKDFATTGLQSRLR